jgi:hypothetical protein
MLAPGLPPGRKQKSAKKIGLRDSATVCAPRSGGRAEGAGIPLIETSSYRTKTMRVESQNPETEQSAEERRCLMCGQAFQSTWAGERICPRCKSTEAWRRG